MLAKKEKFIFERERFEREHHRRARKPDVSVFAEHARLHHPRALGRADMRPVVGLPRNGAPRVADQQLWRTIALRLPVSPDAVAILLHCPWHKLSKLRIHSPIEPEARQLRLAKDLLDAAGQGWPTGVVDGSDHPALVAVEPRGGLRRAGERGGVTVRQIYRRVPDVLGCRWQRCLHRARIYGNDAPAAHLFTAKIRCPPAWSRA